VVSAASNPVSIAIGVPVSHDAQAFVHTVATVVVLVVADLPGPWVDRPVAIVADRKSVV
jgi:hypothetical protein